MKKWRRSRRESEEVNLLPVMNLMVTLIPFLLLGAAFYKLGNIPVSVPGEDSSGSVAEKPLDIKVTVNCSVLPDRIELTASAAGLDEAAANALGAVFANKAGKPDLEGVTEHLAGIKNKYPKSDTVMMVPHGTLRYQELVKVLDATREKKLEGKGPDGEQRVATLFPVTVFMYKPPAPATPTDGAEVTP